MHRFYLETFITQLLLIASAYALKYLHRASGASVLI
ncbi:MAG: hypothetical protein RLY16_100 [Bacteroidota bacterium]|jgi:hypothetical protein